MVQWLSRGDAKTFGLLHTEVNEQLSITADQEAVIGNRGDDTKSATDTKIAELQSQIAKIQGDARNEILQQLTKEQREHFESVFGKPIRFNR